MRDIRIWSKDNKRCEAVWVNHLLTLCGCQVWMARLAEVRQKYIASDGWDQYVDILLFTNIEYDICNYFIDQSPGCGIWVSGRMEEENNEFLWNPFIWGTCEELDIGKPESLIALIRILSGTIAENQNEKAAILDLVNLFVGNNNKLSRCIYTIQEMFCSRRIDYTRYENVGILFSAITGAEAWLQTYQDGLKGNLSYIEMFAIVYLQNLINEGYIKAGKTGGYDAEIMLRNANYLLRSEIETDAVYFLKLQILHNCIGFKERPDDILNMIKEKSKPEYISRAYCEVGDIYREDGEKGSDREVTAYYENAGEGDIENYRGLYRAGLVYEKKGDYNFVWYQNAREKYGAVMRLINRIEISDRTPQEFEYFYKACFGTVKMSIRCDCSNGNMTYEKIEKYCKELKNLISGCKIFEDVVFLKKLYGEGEEFISIKKLMNEKMEKVQNWSKELIAELQ